MGGPFDMYIRYAFWKKMLSEEKISLMASERTKLVDYHIGWQPIFNCTTCAKLKWFSEA